MGSPAVAIDVDEDSGIWRTDGLPMVYLPRHFLVNNHVAVEEALGRETYRTILHAATRKSAVHWCETTATKYGMEREAAFRFYFERLSQRGWGQFSVDTLDRAANKASLTLRNSIFALEQKGRDNTSVCYMFEGFVSGAFHFLLGPVGAGRRIECREVDCCVDGRHEHCRFNVVARERREAVACQTRSCAVRQIWRPENTEKPSVR
jgi:predicted hydrocarbon binding protein